MKAAVIDLGTNTFHLIIAEPAGEELNVLYKNNLAVKLGEGRINENIIIPEAFRRGIAALKSFKEEIDRYNVQVVSAIATSAVRNAENGAEFVKVALKEAAVKIKVISGEAEAEYIYNGVRASGVLSSTSLIMDIGGGSTEFIICDQKKVFWKKSYDIGAARLQQAYFNSDPINGADQFAIQNRLTEELGALKEACLSYCPKQLVGSAGAFETFAEMINPQLDIKQVKFSEIPISAYRALSGILINSTHRERQNLTGLVKLRVDMIVIASLITDFVLRTTHMDRIVLSTYDLKMGVLHRLLKSDV